MLKYQTILESNKFKLSKVKNTTNNKSWYSLIWRPRMLYRINGIESIPTYEELSKTIGKDPYKDLYGGIEWKFKDKELAIKKYNWALLRYS